MLEIKNLQVFYGVIHAIKDVSFTVNEGEVIALIGANGAGKTTILHTITGLIPAKSGEVLMKVLIFRRYRHIRLYLWELHMYRKEGTCFLS